MITNRGWRGLCCSLTVMAWTLVGEAAWAQDTTPAAQSTTPAGNSTPIQTDSDAQDVGADIVVTGFRGSLERALDLKRTQTGSVDAILAADIGKFPDNNLSESIQRIPGVAITRDGGEGRNVSVRGLGPQFTRVRINGMEAIATTSGTDIGGGANRGRGFDFNVFASDLFNAIVVRKTAQAETEEGSLGATVDLTTARPFDFKGFTLSASGQAAFNSLSKKVSPRAAMLVSNRFANDTLGVLFSAAYSENRVTEEGYSTVRWAPNIFNGVANFSPGFQSIGGVACQNSAGTANLTGVAACDTANTAFHPRFPRIDLQAQRSKRLGLTGSIQWKPTDATSLSLDGLYANYRGSRSELFLEAPAFSVSGACTAASRLTNCGIADIDVTSATYKNGALIAGTFNDVDLRTENRVNDFKTEFKQLSLTGHQELGGGVTLNAMGGYARSDLTTIRDNTLIFDQFNADGYSYDYTDQGKPIFGFGTAVLNSPAGWTLSQIRLRKAEVDNSYKTGQFDLAWQVNPDFQVKVGGVYKKFANVSSSLQRSNGTTASQDANIACCTQAGDTLDKFGSTYSFLGYQYFGPDYLAAERYFDFLNPSARNGAFRFGPEPGLNANTRVQETDKSLFVQTAFSRPIGGMMLRGDAGVRYVQTNQTANGFAFLGGVLTPITTDRTYEDFLPAANLVLEATHNLQFRAAAARVMARPDLTSLTPGVSVSIAGANRSVTSGNPNLNPYRADTYDASAEWYFQPGGLISVAYFVKKIDSFVQTLTATGAFSDNPFGLPDSLAIAACGTLYPATCNPAFPNWSFSVPSNTPGGTLRGVEVNYQQPLRFLPGILRNTGVLLNYTHVSSKISYLNGAGAVVAVADLTGLSNNSANATLYYEDKKLSARVSGAYRSNYLRTIPSSQGADREGVHDAVNIDASIQYNLTNQVKVTLEGINLTDQWVEQYVDSRDLQSIYHRSGRQVMLGFRFNL